MTSIRYKIIIPFIFSFLLLPFFNTQAQVLINTCTVTNAWTDASVMGIVNAEKSHSGTCTVPAGATIANWRVVMDDGGQFFVNGGLVIDTPHDTCSIKSGSGTIDISGIPAGTTFTISFTARNCGQGGVGADAFIDFLAPSYSYSQSSYVGYTYSQSSYAGYTYSQSSYVGYTYSQSSYATPTPAPIPCREEDLQAGAVIMCDFEPDVVNPGDTVRISGGFMTGPVYIHYPDASVIQVNASIIDGGTIATFTVPANTPAGDYTLSIGGSGSKATITKVLTVTLGSTGRMEQGGSEPLSATEALTPPPATDFSKLIESLFEYSFMALGIAVFVMIMWGGFLWMTSAANPGNISAAKGIIKNAILGAIVLASSYVILYTINPELVGGTFELKEITVPPPTSTSSLSRVVAFDELGAAGAITAGCILSTELSDFSAISCPADIAGGLGLPADPVIQTSDTSANQQVNATAIQSSGNSGAGRKIVVIDTGYNYNHPELSSSYLGGRDFVNNDNDPMDDNISGAGAPGHGSHVAGIITGDGNDARSRGVAPQTGIIAAKVLNAQGSGNWSHLVEAIYWAINGPDGIYGTGDDFHPDAINISIGGTVYSSACDTGSEINQRLLEAIRYAKNHGTLVIVASGNNSGGVTFPGCLSEAFTVGAVNSSDSIAGFSGRGSPVDVVAPGVNIYSALLGSNYGLKSGTSMATPVVSGIAALIKGAHPNYSSEELERAITSSVVDLGSAGRDSSYGFGRVTANAGGSGIALPPPTPNPTGSYSGIVTVNPPSCTKGAITSNLNCDATLNFTTRDIPMPNSIIIRANGVQVGQVPCSQSACTGSLSFPNPPANIYQVTIHLASNGARVAGTTVNIYNKGFINSNFSSCTKGNVASNLNCNISISYSGSSPGNIVIKKDGANWRVATCSTASCSGTLTDPNPTIGIHTYSLHNVSDNSRIGRATVTITGAGPPRAGSPVSQCDANGNSCLSGQYWPAGSNPSCNNQACVVLNHRVAAEDLTGGLNGGILIRRDGVQIYVVDGIRERDLSAGTRIEMPAPPSGTYVYQMLDGGLGNPANQRQIVSITLNIGVAGQGAGIGTGVGGIGVGTGGITTEPVAPPEPPPASSIVLCTEPNYGGTCETFASSDLDLADNLVSGNSVSSIMLNNATINLCPDIYYGGICEPLSASDPDLSDNPIGNDNLSSMYQ